MELSEAVSFKTPLHCNCLLPLPTGELLLGMYHLPEEGCTDGQEDNRQGGVFSLDMTSAAEPKLSSALEEAAGSMPGVFDIILARDQLSILAPLTDGTLATLRPTSEGNNAKYSVNIAPVHDKMLTSAADISGNQVVCTAHGGEAILFDLAAGSIVQKWEAHEFDAWTVANFADAPSVLWTGGDDGFLRSWDLRAPAAAGSDSDNDGAAASGPTKMLSKRHDAGVVSIAAGPSGSSDMLWVGSYDENLRVYDSRNTKRAVSEVHVGGGAWRTRHVTDHVAVVAAMQGGCAILSHDGSGGDLNHLSSVHDDTDNVLIYDAVPWKAPDGKQLVLTTSFYEDTVKVWNTTIQ